MSARYIFDNTQETGDRTSSFSTLGLAINAHHVDAGGGDVG